MSISTEDRMEFEAEEKYYKGFRQSDDELGQKKYINNGGSTDYYKFQVPKDEYGNLVENIDAQDIIEWREMNFAQGNILKVAWAFNVSRHNGTNYERDLNKIIYFAKRESEKNKCN
jgi:hypothetical protein